MGNMMQHFAVGDEIGGYCNGVFGRDDYEDKICVLVRPTYAVFEYTDGHGAAVLNYDEDSTSYYKSDDWKREEIEDRPDHY